MLNGLVHIGTNPRFAVRQRPAGASGKIVLALPPYSGPPLGPPVGLLSLASTLKANGYAVTIIDGAVEPDFLAATERQTQGALCLGISLLTGPMIGGAIAASRLVKKSRPELPVVFGGWHPSLLPEQTLRSPFIDVVVRNQGELTFLEVVRRLEERRLLEGVAGCSFKQGDRTVHNSDRAVARLQDLPPPSYELADFERYGKAAGKRTLPYATSVGCPYACSYCTDTVFYQRRFNALAAERVVEEVSQLVRRYRIEEVSLLDSNFLVDTKRALQIARGFIESGLRFNWTFQASTDLLCRMSDGDVRVMAKSGLRHIGFGTESGSEKVLSLMNKLHQTIPDMFEAARKAKQAGIRLTFNLIFGYPGETPAHRAETLRVMGEIAARFDNVTFSPNVFTPYPGIPAWAELERRGLKQPDSLEGWQDLALGTNVLPWMRGEATRQMNQSMSIFLMANELAKKSRRTRSAAGRMWLRFARRPLSWRLKHQCYRWPLELWLYQLRRRLAMRRSLLTGRELGYGIDQAC